MAEVRSVFFWRAILAEFLATTLFTCIASGVTTVMNVNNLEFQLKTAICIGFIVASTAYMFWTADAGVMNPAIAIGLMLGRRLGVLRCLFYLLVEAGGGITGTAIMYAVTPEKRRGVLGNLSLYNETTKWQGFAIEGVFTFLLTIVVFAGMDKNRRERGFGGPLAYGVAVAAIHPVVIPYTGCCLNPARILGPAVVMNTWHTYHWIYWAGPIAGGVLGGIIYGLVFTVAEETEGSVDISNDFILERPTTGNGVHSKGASYKYGDQMVYANSNL